MPIYKAGNECCDDRTWERERCQEDETFEFCLEEWVVFYIANRHLVRINLVLVIKWLLFARHLPFIVNIINTCS